MKIRLYILLLGIIIIGNNFSKAQSEYIDTNYRITYTLKLNGIFSPGDAKIAKANMIGMFDSRHFSFSTSDSTIIIRSAYDNSENELKSKLNTLGYNVLYFKKTDDPIANDEIEK